MIEVVVVIAVLIVLALVFLNSALVPLILLAGRWVNRQIGSRLSAPVSYSITALAVMFAILLAIYAVTVIL